MAKVFCIHIDQFGFRVNHFTNLTIVHVVSSLISKINSDKCTVLELLDLKKTFDLKNHKLLSNKLNIYGIEVCHCSGCSYLSSCHQCIIVNNVLSINKPISAGVPQGSILGPLLFIFFC